MPCALAALVSFLISRAIAIDTLYALYTGREVAHSGAPRVDHLTTAGTHSWIDQQWLGQWIFYEIYRIGSYRAVAFFAVALVLAAGLLLQHLLRRLGGAHPVFWSCLAVFALILNTAATRTQSLAYPLFVAVVGALAISARSSKWRGGALVAIPILVLWANVHGSAILGAGLATLCMIWQSGRLLRLGRRCDAFVALGIAVLDLAAVVATPYGGSTLNYYLSLAGNNAVRSHVPEWQPLSPSRVTAWTFLLLCTLAIASIVKGRKSRRADGRRLGLLFTAIGIALAAYSARYAVWASVLLAFVASVYGYSWSPRISRLLLRTGQIAACSLLLIATFLLATVPQSRLTRDLPLRLAEPTSLVLATHPSAVVLTDQVTSAVLLWSRPESHGRVAFDIRYEQYADAQLSQYFEFLRAANPGFACDFGVVTVSTSERPKLVAQIRNNPAWTPTYDGKDGIVAVRTPGVPCR